MKKQLFLIFFLILCPLLASCSAAKASSPAETAVPIIEPAATSPSASELKEGFFLPVSGLEKGTAGSSLKEASGAMKVLSFAENKLITSISLLISISSSGDSKRSHDTVDQDALQSALLDAWKCLSAEEQALFSENYPSLAALLDKCFVDFSALSGLFEDAGVLPEMQALMQNPDVPSAWKLLSDTWANVKTD